VRTMTNIEAGAKTRLSTMLHGTWILGLVVMAPALLSLIPTTALAAVLVYTGFKLVSPKAVQELKPYGQAEVAIYFATLIGIVATNLLVGVLIGLGLALLKLFYTFSHLEVRLHTQPESNETIVMLKGAATFIRLPKLAAVLESIPVGANVHLDIDQLNYIDHACLDLVSQWRKQHIARAGQAYVPWGDLKSRYQARAGRSQVEAPIVVTNDVVEEAQPVNSHPNQAQAPIAVAKAAGD
jgi:MFS superfamily sulfate permease-like transporter